MRCTLYALLGRSVTSAGLNRTHGIRLKRGIHMSPCGSDAEVGAGRVAGPGIANLAIADGASALCMAAEACTARGLQGGIATGIAGASDPQAFLKLAHGAICGALGANLALAL